MTKPAGQASGPARKLVIKPLKCALLLLSVLRSRPGCLMQPHSPADSAMDSCQAVPVLRPPPLCEPHPLSLAINPHHGDGSSSQRSLSYRQTSKRRHGRSSGTRCRPCTPRARCLAAWKSCTGCDARADSVVVDIWRIIVLILVPAPARLRPLSYKHHLDTVRGAITSGAASAGCGGSVLTQDGSGLV